MLWMADSQPRRFAAEQLSVLVNLAELCVVQLDQPRQQALMRTQAAAEAGLGPPLLRK